MKRGAPIVDEQMRRQLLLRTETTLSSFKASVEAEVVAAFDGWRGTARHPDDAPATPPWSVIEGFGCLEIDWSGFKAHLAQFGENEAPCRCGRHFFSAFLIRDRWTLIVLGRQSLVRPASELLPVRTNTIASLARILPELDKDDAGEPPPGGPNGGGGGSAGPAELGIPLWWVQRKN